MTSFDVISGSTGRDVAPVPAVMDSDGEAAVDGILVVAAVPVMMSSVVVVAMGRGPSVAAVWAETARY